MNFCKGGMVRALHCLTETGGRSLLLWHRNRRRSRWGNDDSTERPLESLGNSDLSVMIQSVLEVSENINKLTEKVEDELANLVA